MERYDTLQEEEADLQRRLAQQQAAGASPEDLADTNKSLQRVQAEKLELAPEVTRAYEAARAKMPPEEAPPSVLEPEPLAEPAPEPPAEAEAAPIPGETPEQTAARILNLTQRRASIAQTVAAQLRAAGRPVEEANLAGRLQQFHYESRAARFDGALGTGRELFDKEAPTIASVDVIPTRGKTPIAGRLEITDNIIRLATSHADASTIIHEFGHSWLEELFRDAQHPAAPTELKDDVQAVRDFLKMKEDLPTRGEHEIFADGFVSYVMQGTAPTEGLARVFSKFRQWLTSVYQTIMRSPVKLNDSIQGVYDRLLSHPQAETIIAPEREVGRDFADVHEADAAAATPENAIERANQIRGERDEAAQLLTPEINNARRRTREEAGPTAGRGTSEAGPEGDAVLPRDTAGRGPEPGAEEAGGQPVAISPSGAKFKAKNESPTGGAEPFSEGPTRLVDADGRPVLDSIESPDDVDSAVRLAAQRSGNRGEATPGQLIDLSEATGIDASLIGRTLGRVFDSGEMRALTDLAIDAATDVKNKMVQAAEGGDALELALALARLDMIQAKALQEGAHAWGKAGNALRAFKEATGGNAIDALDKLLKEHTGRSYDQLMQLARMNGALNTPQQVGAAVHQFHNKFTRGVVFTIVNGFLSNPYTHMVYAAGNSLRNAVLVPQAGIAGVIGEVRTGIREALSLTPEDQVYMREAGAALHGITEGFKNALVPALESFKAGQQMPLPGQKGFSSPWSGAYASPFPDAVNNVIGFPGKSVAGIHQFGRVIFYEQHLQRLATRQAIDEGLQGNALSARVARLTSNPSVDMMREAADAADSDMFQRHGNFGSLTRAIEGWTDKYALAKMLFPFVKIGMEITRKQFVEYSPLGMFSHEVRGDLMMRRGGAAFDEAAAKQMIGLGMLGAGVGWAMSGNITGPGPSDPKARSGWLLEHRPFSIAAGNLWIPYKGLGPQAGLLELAVDLVETHQHWDGKDGEKLAYGYMKAIAHSVLSESLFRSTAALTNVFADPGRNAAGFLENLAGAVVPFSSLVGSTNRMFFDPYQKDIEPGFKGFVDGLRAKIPVASWGVPNRIDAFGNDVPSRGTVLWPQGLTSRYANDPTAQWLDSLGTGPGRIDRTIGNVRLTEDQFIDLSRLSGRLGKEFLDDARPVLQGYPRGQQLKEIDHLLNHARHLARVETKLKSMGTSNDIVEQETKLKEQALE
jgi:hypothetical protein